MKFYMALTLLLNAYLPMHAMEKHIELMQRQWMVVLLQAQKLNDIYLEFLSLNNKSISSSLLSNPNLPDRAALTTEFTSLMLNPPVSAPLGIPVKEFAESVNDSMAYLTQYGEIKKKIKQAQAHMKGLQ